MLRTAVKPRWLALLVVAVLVVVAFVQLGRWQLGIAQDEALRETLDAARAQGSVALGTVLEPHQPFPGEMSGRPVTVTGRYAADGEVLVPDRRLDGRGGYWVVSPFLVDGDTGTLPVLRGFVTSPGAVPAPPAGPLTIEGGLAPGESPSIGGPLPEGQLGSVDTSVLVNRWPGDLYNAFLFLDTEVSEAPEAGGAGGAGGAPLAVPPGLTRVPVPTGESGLNWRNAAYALQWWVFAAFALAMWWRMVKDDRDRTLEQQPPTDPESATPVAAGENGTRE